MEFRDLLLDHSYYCSTSNYYSNDGAKDYDCWSDFFVDWDGLDLDMNHVFRFDLRETNPLDELEGYGKYHMEVFFMLQRKGIFRPCTIKNVKESDFESIKKFLKPHWEYTKEMWEPFTNYNENLFNKKIIIEKIDGH